MIMWQCQGVAKMAAAERRDQEAWDDDEARSAQELETYERLKLGTTEQDASDREEAISDHTDRITPALQKLHRAYYDKHSLPAVAEAVKAVADAVNDAFEDYGKQTADYYIEKNAEWERRNAF